MRRGILLRKNVITRAGIRMESEIQNFISYLHNTKKTSGNTEVSYERDLRKMMQYFEQEQQIGSVGQITETSLNSYMLYLERNHFATSTVSRSVASIRAFFQYLYKEHKIVTDPAQHLRPPRVEKKMPEILTVEEVDLLLRQPSATTPKGIRDKAMLELLYATGIPSGSFGCESVCGLYYLQGSGEGADYSLWSCGEESAAILSSWGAGKFSSG